MHIRLALLLTQACTVLTALLLAGTAQAPTTATQKVAAPARTATVTAIRPVTRGLLAKATPPRKARPAPAARTASHPPARTTTRPATTSYRRLAPPAVQAPQLTARQRLDQAVQRIPGYRPGSVQWVLQAKDGYWGTADWYRNVIWISPAVPSQRLYDVVVHEWSHIKSVETYGGDVDLAMREMNRYFGGDGVTGAERAADCMARLDGAQWTHYTACQDSGWRKGAAQLLAGHRL